MPSTVEIKHLEGDVAKNMLIVITSTKKIMKYEKWQSVEDFDIQLKPTQNKFFMTISKFRKGSIIGLKFHDHNLKEIIDNFDKSIVQT